MDTIREIGALVADTARLLAARFPQIAAPLLFGWAARELLILLSVLVSANLIAATMAFVAAMVIWVIALVLALRAALTGRSAYVVSRSTEQLDVRDATHDIPIQRVLVEAVVPFLVVYSAWGLTEEHIQRVFDANVAQYGMASDRFSITFAQWPLYLTIAVIAWITQAVLELTVRDRGGLPVGIGRAFIRGTVILTAFMGLDSILAGLEGWARSRQAWAWVRIGWQNLLDWLPDWQLWWQQTIPEFLRSVVSGLWDFLVPGIWTMVLLPLVWLALTATVVGWQDIGEALTPGRITSRLARDRDRFLSTRAGRAVEAAAGQGPVRMLGSWVASQLDDLLPVVQALRLVLRSGVPFLAAYLLLGAAARTIAPMLTHGLLWVAGPQSIAGSLAVLPAVQLVSEVASWLVQVPLYAIAFERAMRRADNVTGGAPPPAPTVPAA